MFTEAQAHFVDRQRIGRFATADAAGKPHVVPVCYARADDTLYIALDAKPKRVAPRELRRVRNLIANPRVALVIDHYSENWSELAYILIQGSAALLEPGVAEHTGAVVLLRARYPQYTTMPIETQPIIAIRVESVTVWSAQQL